MTINLKHMVAAIRSHVEAAANSPRGKALSEIHGLEWQLFYSLNEEQQALSARIAGLRYKFDKEFP
jgi:hypothetical protein